MLYKSKILSELAIANQSGAMEADTISKNGRSSKSHKSSVNILRYAFFALLSMCIIFSGCDKDDDKGGGANTVNQITVKIENASDFSNVAKVKLQVWFQENGSYQIHDIAEADFINGGFTLKLPETLNAKYLEVFNEEDMPETVVVSNKSAKSFSFGSIYGFNSAGDQIVRFRYENRTESTNTESYAGAQWMYVDSDVNVTGTESGDWKGEENEGVYNVTFALTLKKGWNVYYETYTGTRQGNKYTENNAFRSNPAPSGLKWVGEKWY